MKKSLTLCLRSFLALALCLTQILPAFAAEALNLPSVGTRLHLSPAYQPALLQGLRVYADNPLRFDFIVTPGDSGLKGQPLKLETQKMIKYFLSAMTIPEENLWVNLSPYEKDRIIPEGFGITEMGRDLLGQDYVLKQLTASMIYPEGLGQKFWDEVYKKAFELYGTTEIPMNTFNKVWIVPDTATIYQNVDSVYVVDSRLKVLTEEDYLSMRRTMEEKQASGQAVGADPAAVNRLSAEVLKEVIIPKLEEEINTGKNFAQLRQIYQAMLLAMWFKDNLRKSVLGKVYVDQEKLAGVDDVDRKVKQEIYDQYVEAFKKGAYNFIREDVDPYSQERIPRKYFSGGYQWVKPEYTILSELPADLKAEGAVLVENALNPAGEKEESLMSAADAFLAAEAPSVGNFQDLVGRIGRQFVTDTDEDTLKTWRGRMGEITAHMGQTVSRQAGERPSANDTRFWQIDSRVFNALRESDLVLQQVYFQTGRMMTWADIQDVQAEGYGSQGGFKDVARVTVRFKDNTPAQTFIVKTPNSAYRQSLAANPEGLWHEILASYFMFTSSPGEVVQPGAVDFNRALWAESLAEGQPLSSFRDAQIDGPALIAFMARTYKNSGHMPFATNLLDNILIDGAGQLKWVDVTDLDSALSLQLLNTMYRFLPDFRAIARAFLDAGVARKELQDVLLDMSLYLDEQRNDGFLHPVRGPQQIASVEEALKEVFPPIQGGQGDTVEPTTASTKTALSETEIQQFQAQLPYLDIARAALVPWRELVRDAVKQPSPRNANEQNYWDNNVGVRKNFIELLAALAQGEITNTKMFKDRLAAIHKALLLGQNQDAPTPYSPELKFKPEAFTQAQLDGMLRSARYSAGQYRWTDTDGRTLTPLLDALNRFVNLPADQFGTEEDTQIIFDFYLATLSDEYEMPVFRRGSNSLFMNMINAMLRLHGRVGLAHENLDEEFFAMKGEEYTAIQAEGLDEAATLAKMKEYATQKMRDRFFAMVQNSQPEAAQVSNPTSVNNPEQRAAAVRAEAFPAFQDQQPDFIRPTILIPLGRDPVNAGIGGMGELLQTARNLYQQFQGQVQMVFHVPGSLDELGPKTQNLLRTFQIPSGLVIFGEEYKNYRLAGILSNPDIVGGLNMDLSLYDQTIPRLAVDLYDRPSGEPGAYQPQLAGPWIFPVTEAEIAAAAAQPSEGLKREVLTNIIGAAVPDILLANPWGVSYAEDVRVQQGYLRLIQEARALQGLDGTGMTYVWFLHPHQLKGPDLSAQTLAMVQEVQGEWGGRFAAFYKGQYFQMADGRIVPITAQDIRPGDGVLILSPPVQQDVFLKAILAGGKVEAGRFWIPPLMTGVNSYILGVMAGFLTNQPALHAGIISHLKTYDPVDNPDNAQEVSRKQPLSTTDERMGWVNRMMSAYETERSAAPFNKQVMNMVRNVNELIIQRAVSPLADWVKPDQVKAFFTATPGNPAEGISGLQTLMARQDISVRMYEDLRPEIVIFDGGGDQEGSPVGTNDVGQELKNRLVRDYPELSADRYTMEVDAGIEIGEETWKTFEVLLSELLKNALVEPVGGKVLAQIRKTGTEDIEVSVTNEGPMDVTGLRGRARAAAEEGILIRDEEGVSVLENRSAFLPARMTSLTVEDVNRLTLEDLLMISGLSRGKDAQDGAGTVVGYGLGFPSIKTVVEELTGALLSDEEFIADHLQVTPEGPTTVMVRLPESALQFNDTLGGIDLNPGVLKLKTVGRGVEFNPDFNFQQLEIMTIDGFTPVILQMTPVTNLPLILGASESPTPSLSAIEDVLFERLASVTP